MLKLLLLGTDKLYVRDTLNSRRFKLRAVAYRTFANTLIAIDHTFRVGIRRRLLSQCRRWRCQGQTRRLTRGVQAIAVQLLLAFPPAIRASSLHSHGNYFRPDKHPSMDQEAWDEPG